MLFPILLFFFFQAEDGIRDLYVTGVQTCALPISSRTPRGCAARARWWWGSSRRSPSRWSSSGSRSTASRRRSTWRRASRSSANRGGRAPAMVGETHVAIEHEGDIVTARQKGRELAAAQDRKSVV